MTTADRRLPRGISHLCLQLMLWLAFYFAYNITRGLADRNVSAAFDNGAWIARTEERLGTLFEPSLQRLLDGLSFVPLLTTWTYWFSQFVVVGVALFWVYFRCHDRFAFFRNWLFVANTIGLVCYALIPTAPPRMFPDWGFRDTLARSAYIDHESVRSLANQYAAMPSLHAMDAFIVGVVMFTVVRSPVSKALWLLWPAWVAFALMATANHFWLDLAAGVAIAIAVAAALRPSLVRALLPMEVVLVGPRRQASRARRPTRREVRRTSRRA